MVSLTRRGVSADRVRSAPMARTYGAPIRAFRRERTGSSSSGAPPKFSTRRIKSSWVRSANRRSVMTTNWTPRRMPIGSDARRFAEDVEERLADHPIARIGAVVGPLHGGIDVHLDGNARGASGGGRPLPADPSETPQHTGGGLSD